jgi:hypothetical protein
MPVPPRGEEIGRHLGQVTAAAGATQHPTGRDTDVRWIAPVPRHEPVADGLQIHRAGRGDLGDADRYGGVVGPLPRREAAETATDHRDLTLGGVLELVAGPQRIARRHAQQRPSDPILLAHPCSSPTLPRMSRSTRLMLVLTGTPRPSSGRCERRGRRSGPRRRCPARGGGPVPPRPRRSGRRAPGERTGPGAPAPARPRPT